MTQQNQATSNESDKASSQKSVLIRLAKPLIILLCLTVVSAVLWQLLPKASFSSDLAQLGQGRPGLVLMREVHYLGGEQVLQQMHSIYPEFQQDVMFLVVHTGHPNGVAFAAEHNVRDAGVVLFDAQGQALGSVAHPESADSLRRFIVNTLAANNN
jgi:hypothetical protein